MQDMVWWMFNHLQPTTLTTTPPQPVEFLVASVNMQIRGSAYNLPGDLIQFFYKKS